jgi:5'-nucleotidase
MRILIDMDEVMADAISRFLEWYERDFGIRYTKEQLTGTKLSEVVPKEHRAAVKSYPHQKGFFKDLPLIPNSREVIEELYNRYDIYVASAAMEFKYSLSEKFDWLEEHFPFIHWRRRIFCGDKHLLQADVLIDDHDFNLSVFPGRAIMFTAPHNVNDTKYERLNNWLEARKLFELVTP